MLLSKENLKKITSSEIELPTAESFALPERILQFGTGVLLRGLPDYYVDKANKRGVFNGRILVVKSTASAGADAFDEQDGLYTICIKGLKEGAEIVSYSLNNAISRVLAASSDWEQILAAASNPDLTIVISNTTEVGIVLSSDKLHDQPPASFPGKLLAFLYARYQYFDGAADKGLVILPTELITDNAKKLKAIIHSLADENNLGEDFKNWIDSANDFCNTLVDRIVPGKLPAAEQAETEASLGYQDALMIMAEPFSLWAIETDSARVRERLSFSAVDSGVVLVPSIDKFKELKLRLLNGAHTLSCAAALWSGFVSVKEAMSHTQFNQFVRGLMQKEIGQAMLDRSIEQQDVDTFSNSVIDRFSNPFLEHRWANIALNYTSKISLRNIALLDKWYAKKQEPPRYIALGFAAYLKLMDSTLQDDKFVQNQHGETLTLQDEFAPILHNYWKDPSTVVHNVLSDGRLWGEDLSLFPDFETSVQHYLNQINEVGVLNAIEKLNVSWQVEY